MQEVCNRNATKTVIVRGKHVRNFRETTPSPNPRLLQFIGFQKMM
jgi:hypothetical protein